MMIKLNKVKFNPYRDMVLDPINSTTVDMMKESIADLGFWGGLAVRKVGTDYEIAFGHHRLTALRDLGWKEADLNVVEFGDDQMVRAMVKENATQRGGEGGATLDAVAGIIKRIGYVLLTKTNEEIRSGKILPLLSYIDKARNSFLKGEGIGWSTICQYEPSLSVGSVKHALVTLKESNHLHVIAESIQEMIAEDINRAEIAAEKAKTEAAKKKAADELAEAKADMEQADAAAEATEGVKEYDPLVDNLFSRDVHSAAFKEVVLSEEGRKYIPVEKHLEIAKTIIAEAAERKDGKKDISSEYVRTSLMTILNKAQGWSKRQEEKADANTKAQAKWKSLQSKVTAMAKDIAALEVALDAGGRVSFPTEVPTFFNIHVNSLITQLTELEERLNNAKNVVSYQ